MADIYRRMESASGWMENYEEAAQRKSPPPQDSGPPVSQANRPLSTAAATSPSPPNSAKKSKKRKPKKMPQSLPFLKQTIITDIIVGEELRAREAADGAPPRSPSDPMFHPLEVLKFFRALYVHGACSSATGARDLRIVYCCVAFSHQQSFVVVFHEPQVGKVGFIGSNKNHESM